MMTNDGTDGDNRYCRYSSFLTSDHHEELRLAMGIHVGAIIHNHH